MSFRRVKREVDSPEFTDWLAFYEYEAEMMGLVERTPSSEELGAKMRSIAAIHNAKLAAKG